MLTRRNFSSRNPHLSCLGCSTLVSTLSFVNVNNLELLYSLCHVSHVHNPQRRRKRAHKGSENVTRRSAKAGRRGVSRAGGGHGKRRHVEAVTLFEVVTMGRSAMQARLAHPLTVVFASALDCLIIRYLKAKTFSQLLPLSVRLNRFLFLSGIV